MGHTAHQTKIEIWYVTCTYSWLLFCLMLTRERFIYIDFIKHIIDKIHWIWFLLLLSLVVVRYTSRYSSFLLCLWFRFMLFRLVSFPYSSVTEDASTVATASFGPSSFFFFCMNERQISPQLVLIRSQCVFRVPGIGPLSVEKKMNKNK